DIDIQAGMIDDLSLGTASGDIQLAGALGDGGDYEVQSVSGSVELSIPGDSRLVAELATISGDLECALPNESQRSGRRKQKLLINGGNGPTLRINTTSGDVNISELHDAPPRRTERRAVTEPLSGNPDDYATARVEGNPGNTVRMDSP